jgi:antitoxin HicB
MLVYPAKFTPAEEGGFNVSFPDVPEALTQGDNEQEAKEHATEALQAALSFYFERGQRVPLPSKVKVNHRRIALPLSMSAKVLLWNKMLSQRATKITSARRRGVSR